MDPARRVVLVAFDDLQALDLTGPNEVFSIANRIRKGAYEVEIVAPTRSFTSWSGVRIEAHTTIGACRGPIGTPMVAAGDRVPAAHKGGRSVASVRSGARR